MQELIYKIDNWSLIKLLGGFSAILIAFIVFLGKYLSNRLIQSSQYLYDSRIEKIRGEIIKNNGFLDSLIQNHFSSSQKILDKRILAYELLWKTIIRIRDGFPAGVSLVYQLLPDSRIESKSAFQELNENKKMSPLLNSYDIDIEMNKIVEIANSIHDFKPFISDNSYKLFYTYQGLIGRITHNFIWEFNNGKLYNWKNDDALKSILKITLSDKEVSYIMNLKIAALDSLIELIEYKIIQDFRKSLNIIETTVDTIEHIQGLEKMLQKSNG